MQLVRASWSQMVREPTDLDSEYPQGEKFTCLSEMASAYPEIPASVLQDRSGDLVDWIQCDRCGAWREQPEKVVVCTCPVHLPCTQDAATIAVQIGTLRL